MILNALATLVVGIAPKVFDVPVQPGYGFAVDKDGSFLIAARVDGKQACRVSRYKPVAGGMATKIVEYNSDYEGAVEILPLKSGFMVVDFEGSSIYTYSDDGKQQSKIHARYPNVAKLDFDGNAWFFFNSGIVASLTSDSSVPEPALRASGEEIAVHGAADLGPTSRRKFWMMNEGGEVSFYDEFGRSKKVGTYPDVQRLFGMKNGNVLLYFGKVFKVLSPNGALKEVATVPAEHSRNITFMGRAFDGSLTLATSNSSGGKVVIFDFKLGAL